MANISSSFGTLTIEVKAENAKKEKELIYKFKKYINLTLGKVCYSTYIEPNFKVYEGGDTDFTSTGIYGQGSFLGVGRWSYEANVSRFYDWLKEDSVDNDEYNYHPTQEIKDLWAEINKHSWRITFDYTDEEGGNLVLYTKIEQVVHKAGEDKAEVLTLAEENYDYTPENLVDLDVYECIEDAREACGEE